MGKESSQNNSLEKKLVEVKKENSLADQIISDIDLMARFAFRKGKTVDVSMEGYENNKNIDELSAVHAKLSQIVAPATPRTIAYVEYLKNIAKSKNKKFIHPLIYKQLTIGIIALFTFFVTSVTTYVNKQTLAGSVEDLEGLPPFVTLIFLASLSVLGVIFSTFRVITNSVKDGSALEEDNYYYYFLMIIGIISGIIFSKVFHFDLSDSHYSGVRIDGIFFSFLGGFSAETLREIILSLMSKVKIIFKINTSNKEQ